MAGRNVVSASNERSAFAGGDQHYLRTGQYASGRNLDASAHLHRTYGTATESLFGPTL